MALTDSEKAVLRILIDRHGGAQQVGAEYAEKADEDIRSEITIYATQRVNSLNEELARLNAEKTLLEPFAL